MLRSSLVQAGHRAGLSDLTFRGLNARPHSSQSRYTRDPCASFFPVVITVMCFRQSFLSEGRTVVRSLFTLAARSGQADSAADCTRISLSGCLLGKPETHRRGSCRWINLQELIVLG